MLAVALVGAAGRQVAYERAGSGPALVLLHGYVGDGPTWRPQLDARSGEFTGRLGRAQGGSVERPALGGSAWTGTPSASPDSSRSWVSSRRVWTACRSAASPVHGELDVGAPPTVAESLHAAIAGSRLVVLRGAGHVCNIDAPVEFDGAVRSLLHEASDQRT